MIRARYRHNNPGLELSAHEARMADAQSHSGSRVVDSSHPPHSRNEAGRTTTETTGNYARTVTHHHHSPQIDRSHTTLF